jgi:hypothetical protein
MVVHVAGLLVAQMEAATAEEATAEMKAVQTAVAPVARMVAWVTAAVMEVLEGMEAETLEVEAEKAAMATAAWRVAAVVVSMDMVVVNAAATVVVGKVVVVMEADNCRTWLHN